MKNLSDLPVGVQYYRQPTPLPDEWDGDLAAIRDMGFEMIQLRPQWRWHERNEGELDFSDLDTLFDLAEKHGLKVLFKFYLPCAPQWLFDNYDVMRVKPNGEKMLPLTHGAIYIGGFMPCFDNDLVREKALGFIHGAVKRYAPRQSLVAWNAWNEARSAPMGDCACAASQAKWRAWLKGRFGTIENYNAWAGLAESGKGDDFSYLKAPVTVNDYAGLMLFRAWRAEMVADRLKWVRDEIKSIDPCRPVISHVGYSSVIQDALNDTSNDYLNARSVDFFGSSCPNRPDDLGDIEHRPTAYQAATVDLICSRLRGVSDPFWINEIYGNRGMYMPPLSPAYTRQTTYHCLASGARGLLFWQYRSERLTTESNDAGLVTRDGRPTDRSREVARTIKVIKRLAPELSSARPTRAQVAVMYDFSSDLISKIAATASGPMVIERQGPQDYPYKSSLRGIHLALWEMDIPTDIVASELFEQVLDYPVLYLPCPQVVSGEQAEILRRFVEGGGLLISEPSPGMRQANGWATPAVPPPPLDALFGCSEQSRLFALRQATLGTDHGPIVCPSGVFLSTLAVDGRHARAEAIGHWDNSKPAVVGNRTGQGRTILLGAPLGEVYFRTHDKAVLAWLAAVLDQAGLSAEALSDAPSQNLRLRRLVRDDGAEIIFAFNYLTSPQPVTIRARGMERIDELSDLGVEFSRAADQFVTEVPGEQVLIVKLSR